MFLEKAKVQNFRGIRSLAVDFEENSTFLIGENQWGKTSFLKALWMVLGKGTPCKFEKEDLYVPIEIKNSDNFVQEDLVALVTGRESLDFESNKDELDEQKRDYQVELKNERHLIENLDDYLGSDEVNFEESDDVFKNIDGKIKIDLYFKESIPVGNAENHKNLKNYWYYDDDGFYRIHYQVVAFTDKQGNFVTYHNLIDKKGMYFKHDPKYENAIQTIIDLNPIFRLRIGNMGGLDSESVSQERIRTVLDKLNNDEKISAESVGSFVSTFSNFFEKYFADYSQNHELEKNPKNGRRLDDIVKSPMTLESISNIKKTLLAPGFNRSKALVSFIALNILMSKGNRTLDKSSRPIFIFEDIEARFHPSILLSFWSLFALSDVQKIVTTNSGDLLSAVSLESLRRLQKRYYDTKCYKVDTEFLNNEDLRRIAFHIRLNRPMVFFARTWLLVEGETEVWILTQIASVLGISLACEGIRIIEFAQCGLKPLIKVAMQLGINFHVLTDGDEAGQKYTTVTSAFIPKKKKERYLTTLPHKDIEHYLYASGYDKTFKNAAGLSCNNQLKKGLTMDKIIEMAIKRKSKPGLALLLVDAIQKRGIRGVPVVFAKLLQNVRALSHDSFI